MNVLIIEDEELAQEELVRIIENRFPQMNIAAILCSVADSVKWLSCNEADLIFMDIHLSDGICFDIFKEVDVRTPIIFTTAYEQYAINAFKVNGIGYLLKPIVEDDLAEAVGKLEKVHVFGNDYPTKDGTGVRDYIHVVDLAEGHVCAVRKLFENSGLYTVNLGTGCGYSVLEIINAFSKALGRQIPYEFSPRRPGDIAECYADPSLAEKLIGFRTVKTLDDMCRDALNFQLKNPDGYPDDAE